LRYFADGVPSRFEYHSSVVIDAGGRERSNSERRMTMPSSFGKLAEPLVEGPGIDGEPRRARLIRLLAEVDARVQLLQQHEGARRPPRPCGRRLDFFKIGFAVSARLLHQADAEKFARSMARAILRAALLTFSGVNSLKKPISPSFCPFTTSKSWRARSPALRQLREHFLERLHGNR